jgi:hypothetical protein
MPGIHVFLVASKDVDGRDKAGHGKGETLINSGVSRKRIFSVTRDRQTRAPRRRAFLLS